MVRAEQRIGFGSCGLWGVTTLLINCCLIGCGSEVDRPSAQRSNGDEACKRSEVVPSPISVQDTIKSVRLHGFSAPGTGDSVCTVSAATEITNIGQADVNSGDPDEIRRREGHLICRVEQAPIMVHGGTFKNVTVIIDEPGKLSLVIENVSCTLYVEGSRSDARRAAIVAALHGLEE
jgi:hypothetical protein